MVALARRVAVWARPSRPLRKKWARRRSTLEILLRTAACCCLLLLASAAAAANLNLQRAHLYICTQPGHARRLCTLPHWRDELKSLTCSYAYACTYARARAHARACGLPSRSFSAAPCSRSRTGRGTLRHGRTRTRHRAALHMRRLTFSMHIKDFRTAQLCEFDGL